MFYDLKDYKNDIKNEKIYDDIVKIIGGLYE